MICLPNGRMAIKAEYSKCLIEEYNNNPLIEALPPLCNKRECIQQMAIIPTYKREELELEGTYRLHMIQRLYKMYQPLPIHLDIWDMTISLIRQGYISRNPWSPTYIKSMHMVTDMMKNNISITQADCNFITTASTGVIIGFSGMGKTTTVNRVLSNIPPIIIHNNYEGQDFSQIQLPWIKLEAPHDASIKALCLQFFLKVDEILGSNYYKTYVAQRLSTDTLLPLMGKVGQSVALGVLVIDELQHLIGKNLNKVMNFFVTLINSFGIPVLFIGTPGAYPVFQQELRLSRRLTGHGEIVWNNMDNDQTFQFFLESIWKYQWLKEFAPLSQELVQVFYEETQGISDLIIKLFVSVQEEAIKSRIEHINVKLVKQVAKNKFRAMSEMIQAIKSRNPYKLSKYDDIKVIEEKAEEVIKYSVKVGKTTSMETVPKNIPVNEVKKETVIKKKQYTYEKGDLRKIVNEAKEAKVSITDLLMKEGFIDDMKRWEE